MAGSSQNLAEQMFATGANVEPSKASIAWGEYADRESVHAGPYYDLGCQGGDFEGGMKYIIDEGGIALEEEYPYIAEDSKCSRKKASHRVRMFISIAENACISVFLVTRYPSHDRDCFPAELAGNELARSRAMALLAHHPPFREALLHAHLFEAADLHVPLQTINSISAVANLLRKGLHTMWTASKYVARLERLEALTHP